MIQIRVFTVCLVAIINLVYCQNLTKVKLHTINLYNTSVTLNVNDDLTKYSGFCSDPSCVNYFLIHGFQASSDSSWVADLKNALFKQNSNINVFLVDWSKGSSNGYFEYETAVQNINVTVRELSSYVIAFTRKNYFTLTDGIINVHCIGRCCFEDLSHEFNIFTHSNLRS